MKIYSLVEAGLLFMQPFTLHYEGGDPSGDPPAGDPPAGDPPKSFTQDELDRIVQERLARERKTSRETLTRLETLQKNLQLTEEQKQEMEQEMEKLRKQTMSAQEIAEREKKRAQDEYKSQVEAASKSAKDWETRFVDLKINYEISAAAQTQGVLPSAVPFLEKYLKDQVEVVPEKDGDQVTGFNSMVHFNDVGADGKPFVAEVSIADAIKRMKELPDQYGHLFAAQGKGGFGGSSGNPGGSPGKIDVKNLTPEQYAKLRRENPELLYGTNS